MIITVIRTLIMYVFITLAIRLMGKRQIGDMQPNELVVTILISEIAAIPLQDVTQPVFNGIVAIFVLIIIEVMMSVLVLKSTKLRKLMSGSPVIVVKDGEPDLKAMQQVRVTILDLCEMLRAKDIFDISEVEYAVLEVNGEISVVKKWQYREVQMRDTNKTAQNDGLPLPVISDGKIIEESLKMLNMSSAEFEKKYKPKKIKDITLMTLDDSGKTQVIRRKKK